ncbi:unnamed protein product [Microthlaspi erraticum]|uniref:F-box associated beta-propeller type 1 domain-containing protein n=1 Tax=Microthlaspi erraticum TaxID=1685480 RepID=A0A6D2HPD6_9BRAS|nr:unnamed protein product [Microthlaspi erraticum]
MLSKNCMLFPMGVNLHGAIPSVEVMKTNLSLLDPDYNDSCKFEISQIFHCDGFLLCTNKDQSRFVVWNPCTGQTRWFKLPKCGMFKTDCRTFVLGYDDRRSCNHKRRYKILSSYQRGNGMEIYEFDSDTWRNILGDDIALGCETLFTWSSKSLKGNAYMFARRVGTNHGLFLLRFDFSTEKSRLLSLPSEWDTSFEATRLSVIREEKLSVLLQLFVTSRIEIWVTDKIGNETKEALSWSKILSMDWSSNTEFSFFTSFVLDEEKKVVMCCNRHIYEDKREDLVFIVGEDNEVTRVHSGVNTCKENGYTTIFHYVPSLLQIEQARGKRKRGD